MVALRYLNTENQAWWIVFSCEMNLIMIKPWVFPDLRSWFVYLLADCFSFLFGLQDLTDIVDYPETVTKKYSYSHMIIAVRKWPKFFSWSLNSTGETLQSGFKK